MRLWQCCVLLLIASIATWASDIDGVPTYCLGPEDVITITVLDHPEFSGDYYIPDDGAIKIPGLAVIQVNGKTLTALTGIVTEQLQQNLKKPEVSISLKVARQQRVYLLGDVAHPGVYEMKPGWRITEALAVAGGVTKPLAELKVTILRGSTDIPVDIHKALIKNDPTANLPIACNDTVMVKAVEAFPIYVFGSVKQPGIYDIVPTSGILEALAQAGGLSIATQDANVTLYRKSEKVVSGVLPEILQHAPSAMPGSLARGDVIQVESRYSLGVMVAGKVRQPGAYSLSPGVSLRDALAIAGGPLENVSVRTVTLVRQDGTRQLVNLADNPSPDGASSEIPLKAGDLIIVPDRTLHVSVLGYVNKPGQYPLPDGQPVRLADVIALAGGQENRRGGIRQVAILRSSHGTEQRLMCDLKQYFSKADLKHNPEIHPDDIVFVPETDHVDWDLLFRGLSSMALLYEQVLN